jgi:hypothetical protein
MPLEITTTELGAWTKGVSECQTIRTSGGTGVVTFSISAGYLPSGLVIDANNGNISGAPKRQGAYLITVRAADSAAHPEVKTQQYSITVSASLGTKIGFAAGLSLFTLLIVVAVFCVFDRLESGQSKMAEVSWPNGKKLNLKPGPAAFSFDPKLSKLQYRGVVNDETKNSLLALIDGDDPSYTEAINSLAFQSINVEMPGRTLWLLGLSGLAGVVGVQLRSLHDFVGNCCYKRQLDTATWWPWYFLRPPVGFLLGMLVIALFKSDLLTVNRTAEDSSMWWFGLATIAGFGEIDVFKRLRLVSATIFGADRETTPAKPGSTANT